MANEIYQHSDPSELTTKQLHREIQVLNELLDARFTGTESISIQRFASVDKQFELMEKQRVEQKADTKAAVDAALTAQKEAVKEQTIASDRAIAKSETAMTKQLEQLSANFTTAINGVSVQMNDSKDRIVKIESQKQGSDGTVAKIFAGVAAAAAIVAIVMFIVNMART